MGVMSGNPQDEPMHYGEVYGIWSSVLATHEMIAGYQTMLNHAGDEDLIQLIKEAIQMGQQEVKEQESFLKQNGVGLPPAPPERPEANLDEIPAGARFQDPEIAASLSANTAASLVACSKMMGQCIREDIIAMYGQFHTQTAAFGGKVLRTNKEKGWLIPPPLHQHGTE
ncbi:DUF3231 family protein [Virgibacillus xinjiangensis]|uniref:DUF3231 family protein n=1 Tax=Virgibacillus xinjiangensis TaxID=393090 RepID=A0ABV7CXD8_9BACI